MTIHVAVQFFVTKKKGNNDNDSFSVRIPFMFIVKMEVGEWAEEAFNFAFRSTSQLSSALCNFMSDDKVLPFFGTSLS